MKGAVQGSLDAVLAHVEDPVNGDSIRRSSFEAALDGIRSGKMTYHGDSLLPMLEKEMTTRLERFRTMSKEDESRLMSISDEQRRIIADNDRKLKNEFLAQAPHITHGSVKNHDKYRAYMQMVQSATR